MISKRKLMIYRQEALQRIKSAQVNTSTASTTFTNNPTITTNKRILELTQELIDQHLLKDKII